MILDDDRPARWTGSFDDVDDPDGVELVDEFDDAVIAGDFRAGLRAAGLPVPSRPTSTVPSPAVRRLLATDAELADPSPAARAFLHESVAQSTERAYSADWAFFDRWCHVHGYGAAADASELIVVEFVAAQIDRGLAMSTIRRRLAAIAYAHRLQGRQPPIPAERLRVVTRNAARQSSAHRRRQAAPLRLVEMRELVVRLRMLRPHHPALARDQLLIALGWAAALRASELVSLDVDDLEFVGDPDRGDGGVLVRIRRSETNQTGRVDHVAVPYASHFSTCPARVALRRKTAVRAGPLFRSIDRYGRPGGRLSAAAVTPIVRRLVADLLVVEGLPVDPAPYSSHSLRAGFVTEARAREVPDSRIARHTRRAVAGHHRGGILDVYDRPHSRFERPALDPDWW